MRNIIKENKLLIKSMMILIAIIAIIMSVTFGGSWLIDNDRESDVFLILFILIIWVIYLYMDKSYNKKQHKQLLDFAHKFYEKNTRIDEDEHGWEDYTLRDFEEEFSNWQDEFREWLKEKEDQLGFKPNEAIGYDHWLREKENLEESKNRLIELKTFVQLLSSHTLGVLVGKSLMHIGEMTADIPRLKEYVDEDEETWDEIYDRMLENKEYYPNEIVQLIDEYYKSFQECGVELLKNNVKNDRILEMNNNLMDIADKLIDAINKTFNSEV